MLTPPVPIPASSYILAYHLKSRDASPAPSTLRAERARNRQISNGRLYLPLLSDRCDRFRVFAYARHRAHAGATCRWNMISYTPLTHLFYSSSRATTRDLSRKWRKNITPFPHAIILNSFQNPQNRMHDAAATLRIPCRQSRRASKASDYNTMPRAAHKF